MAKKRTKKKATGARPNTTAADEIPPGFTLRHTLRGHKGWIGRIAWSPDGRMIASPSADETIQTWDAETGALVTTLKGHEDTVISVAWSPDGRAVASACDDSMIQIWDRETGEVTRTLRGHGKPVKTVGWSQDSGAGYLASGSYDNTVRLWNAQDGKEVRTLEGHKSAVISVAWSPDGRMLTSGSCDDTICVWDARTGALIRTLEGHGGDVNSVAWSPDGRTIASASDDRTVRVWDVATGEQRGVLEGHTGGANCVSFSSDGRMLASKADDVRLWRCDTWETIAVLREQKSNFWPPGLAFHPTLPALATLGEEDTVIRIWDLDVDVLLGRKPSVPSAHYANAKVVLVGDTSVGKTGLGLVLAGRRFRATESTHGRHVWMLESKDISLGCGRKATHETILWDLAGQPAYRLIHQLHLSEVAVALVLFDSRSETDPFAGVAYWARALDEATRGFPLVKFLVASRIDRGGPQVSKERIQEVVDRYGFDGFFETSAKRGDAIDSLRKAIRKAIQWDKLPIISTTELFKSTRDFLVNQKKQGRFIANDDDLLSRLRKSRKQTLASPGVFTTCLGRLESVGFVRRMSYGNQVLLQPEMLDDYCGWLALAARKQPDGLGFIPEKNAQRGQFEMDDDRRLAKRPAEEKTMLLVTVEEVVGRGVAIRQQTDEGAMLVFPSELSSDLPDYPGGYSLAVAFGFEGPVTGIYATLAVTLINSVTFQQKDLYKNAALFEGPAKQVCGFAVEYPDKTNDAVGRLTVFFEHDTDKSVRLLFLRYVNQQLNRLAFERSVKRQRIYYCDTCDETIPQKVVEKRIDADKTTVRCPVCERRFLIDDLAERSTESDKQVDVIEADAAAEQGRQKRVTVLEQKKRGKEFDVFLCHNSKDKPFVRELAGKLVDQGVLPWIDEKEIQPGDLFTEKLEEGIDAVGAIAVIVGPHGPGRWQEMEYHAAIQRYVEERDDEGRRRARVIPVLLPGVARKPRLPLFLRGLNYVDLRKGGLDDRQQMRRLVEAILSDQAHSLRLIAPRVRRRGITVG